MRSLGAALVVLAAVSCGGDAPEAAGEAGTEVTRGLLAGAQQGPSTMPGPNGRPTPVRDVPLEEVGFDRGSDDAPVRVVEMSDYGCGYCRKFHEETFPALRDEFIETGKVQWKFVPYVTGMFDNSMAALRSAECTLEQSADAFERLNDRLWEEQSEWKSSGDAEALVRSWADEAGADMDQYDACHAEGRRFERIAAAGGLARQLGVRGTPTFFVLGYGPLQGALPLDTFRQILALVHEDVTSGQ